MPQDSVPLFHRCAGKVDTAALPQPFADRYNCHVAILQFPQPRLPDAQLSDAKHAKEDAEQEAAYLQQDLNDAEAAYQDAVRCSEEQQQAREDAEEACEDLRQELKIADAAREGAAQLWEKEKQAREHAESEVASLQQHLEQAGVAQKVAVTSLKLEMKQAELHATTLFQVCLHKCTQAPVRLK